MICRFDMKIYKNKHPDICMALANQSASTPLKKVIVKIFFFSNFHLLHFVKCCFITVLFIYLKY